MSTPRRLPLLVIVFGLVLGACLPGSVRASDPTVGCYAPVGDSTTGVWLPSDAGYYDLMGLQSTASTNYNVLCAWRGLYNYGPNGETQVWGPWHGNNHASTQYCDQAVVTEFQDANDWALAFSGSVGARINNATGKLVIVWFELEGVCSANVICAGICPGTANYAANIAAAQADPTYRVRNFTTGSTSAPAGTVEVFTMLNSTASTTTTIAPPNPNAYPWRVFSVITSVQPCYGFIPDTC